MTRIEEIEKASKEYRKSREECGVEDPILLDEVDDAHFMGAIWADKTMLEKACKWLYEYCRYGCCEYIEKNDFINDFKKAMEDKK